MNAARRSWTIHSLNTFSATSGSHLTAATQMTPMRRSTRSTRGPVTRVALTFPATGRRLQARWAECTRPQVRSVGAVRAVASPQGRHLISIWGQAAGRAVVINDVVLTSALTIYPHSV